MIPGILKREGEGGITDKCIMMEAITLSDNYNNYKACPVVVRPLVHRGPTNPPQKSPAVSGLSALCFCPQAAECLNKESTDSLQAHLLELQALEDNARQDLQEDREQMQGG